MRLVSLSLAAALGVGLLAADARAATVFSSTQTGAELASNPKVALFGSTPQVSGDQLNIGLSFTDATVLDWSLFSGGGSYQQLRAEVAVDYTRTLADMDIAFGLRSGSTELFLRRYDDGNSGLLRLYERAGGSLTSTTLTNLGTQGNGAQQTFHMVFDIDLVGHVVTISGQQDDQSGNPFYFDALPSASLDVNAAGLAFIVVGSSGSERYAIDQVAVNVSAVPLPAALPLLAVGAAAVSAVGARRRRASRRRVA